MSPMASPMIAIWGGYGIQRIEFWERPADLRFMQLSRKPVWILALTAILPAALSANPKRANVDSGVLMIAITDNAETPGPTLRAMQLRIGTLLNSCGIRAEWAWGNPGKRPTQPSGADRRRAIPQVSLAIAADKPATVGKDHLSLGLILTGTNQISLHVAEIRRFADYLGIGLEQLMGYVAVHEIGHWLLGPEHSPTGVMLKDWCHSEFLVLLRQRIPFLPSEVMRIRLELQLRQDSLGASQEAPGLPVS